MMSKDDYRTIRKDYHELAIAFCALMQGDIPDVSEIFETLRRRGIVDENDEVIYPEDDDN